MVECMAAKPHGLGDVRAAQCIVERESLLAVALRHQPFGADQSGRGDRLADRPFRFTKPIPKDLGGLGTADVSSAAAAAWAASASAPYINFVSGATA